VFGKASDRSVCHNESERLVLQANKTCYICLNMFHTKKHVTIYHKYARLGFLICFTLFYPSYLNFHTLLILLYSSPVLHGSKTCNVIITFTVILF
jgi:hypothetical protein